MESDPAQSHSCVEPKTPLGVVIRIVATGGRGVEGGRVGSVDMLAKGHKVAARWRKDVKVNVLMSIVTEYCC